MTKLPTGAQALLVRNEGVTLQIELDLYNMDIEDLLMMYLIEHIWNLKSLLHHLSFGFPDDSMMITQQDLQAEALLVAFQQEMGLKDRRFLFSSPT